MMMIIKQLFLRIYRSLCSDLYKYTEIVLKAQDSTNYVKAGLPWKRAPIHECLYTSSFDVAERQIKTANSRSTGGKIAPFFMYIICGPTFTFCKSLFPEHTCFLMACVCVCCCYFQMV